MKLREYQAKAIFAANGLSVPRGEVVDNAVQAKQVAQRLGGPTVIKPQLGIKGRGKVGGIGFAETPAQAAEQAARLLGSTVRGELVHHVLVEQRVRLAGELYLAVAVDYGQRQPVALASDQGGVEIEEVARTQPASIVRVPCSVLRPPSAEELAPVKQALGEEAAATLLTLYRIFIDCEAEQVEVNPVGVTDQGLVALDAVINVNDDALPRHPELQRLRQQIRAQDVLVEEARQQSWTYIDLSGEIAILSSGAGLTMTIVDLLARRGSSAANFLDTAQIDGPGIYRAFELLRRARPPKVWLINIFAGLNRCDDLARGICDYLADHPVAQPVVVRMVGNMEQQGHQLLREVGIEPVRELEQAIDRCVELARSGGVA